MKNYTWLDSSCQGNSFEGGLMSINWSIWKICLIITKMVIITILRASKFVSVVSSIFIPANTCNKEKLSMMNWMNFIQSMQEFQLLVYKYAFTGSNQSHIIHIGLINGLHEINANVYHLVIIIIKLCLIAYLLYSTNYTEIDETYWFLYMNGWVSYYVVII